MACQGYYVLCILAVVDGTMTLLWNIYVDDWKGAVVGQIIGVNNNMLIAQTYEYNHNSEIIGVKLGQIFTFSRNTESYLTPIKEQHRIFL